MLLGFIVEGIGLLVIGGSALLSAIGIIGAPIAVGREIYKQAKEKKENEKRSK